MAILGIGKKSASDKQLDKMKKWQRQVEAADKYFQKHMRTNADRMVAMYELKHYYDAKTQSTPSEDFDRITVPYPYSNSRQIISQTFVKTPEPIVKPLKKNFTVMVGADESTGVAGVAQNIDTIAGASKLKWAINYAVSKSSLKKEGKWMVMDGTVTGLGCIMISGQKTTKLPKFTRVTYKDILWSPEVYDPYKSPWIVRRLIRKLEDVQKDEMYNADARKKVKGNARIDAKLYGQDMQDFFSEFNYVVLWDAWDKENDEHIIWPDAQPDVGLFEGVMSDEFAFSIEDDDFQSDWPFTFYVNEEMLSKAWGMGDIAPMESQVRLLDKIRTMMAIHVKRFNRKYLYQKGFLNEGAIEQFKNPEDGTMVMAERAISDLEFQVVQDAPLSADIYQVGDVIREDINIIGPLGPDALRSGVGNGPDTLGEAQIIAENSDTRLDEKRDNIAMAFARLFRQTGQFIQQYWVDTDEFLAEGDGTKAGDWVTYNPNEVQGEYIYEVDSETLRDNNAVFRKQASDALSIAGPTLSVVYPTGQFILLKKYLETFRWSDLEDIVPSFLTKPPAWADPKAEEVIEAVQTMGIDAYLAQVEQMPDNERDQITDLLNRIIAGGGVPPGGPGMPGAGNPMAMAGGSPTGGGTPTNSAIAGGANNTKK